MRTNDTDQKPCQVTCPYSTIVGLDTIAHLDENAAMAAGFKPLKSRQRAAITREVQLALGNYPAPWDMPGYSDGVIV